MEVTITGDFALIGKARPRMGRWGAYTPLKTKAAERAVSCLAARAMAGRPPMDGPIRLTLKAVYAPPESWSKKKRAAAMGTPKETKPDADNILKLVKDAMNKVVYVDDARVADLAFSKTYGEQDGFTVTVATKGD